MHICPHPFLRSFARGGGSCANPVSIPVFLAPSVTFIASASAHRSYPRRDGTPPALLTASLNRRRTLCTAPVQSGSDVFHGRDDNPLGSGWLGETVQSAASLQPQVERLPVPRHEFCAAGTGREAPMVGWGKVEHWAGGKAGTPDNCGNGQSAIEAGEPTDGKTLAALINSLDALCVNGYSCHNRSFLHAVDRIIALKGVLDRESSGKSTPSWDQVAWRILNAAGPLAETNSRLLERILSLGPDYEAQTGALHPLRRDTSSSKGVHQGLDHSAIIASLLFRLLGLYARSGNITASIHVWSRLQNLIDLSKLAVVEDFFARLKSRSGLGDGNKHLKQEHLDSLPHIYYRIPIPILADFFNLITENHEFEFGRWLLYSRDADGPVIPEQIYSNASLAPLLVDFAAATSDADLLSKVISYASRPFSANMVRALLRHEIGLHRWSNIENILASICSHRKYYWTETELAKLVVVILRIERDVFKTVSGADIQAKSESLKAAKTILSQLMSGYFGKPKPLKRIPRRFSGVDQYTDLLRYLVCTALPSHTDIHHDISYSRKPTNTGYLDTGTFNMLLRGIVETQGSERGRRFWDLWCRTPERSDTDADTRVPSSRYPVLELSDERAAPVGPWGYEEDIKGLRPDIGTLRAIIQGALKEKNGMENILKHDLAGKQDSSLAQDRSLEEQAPGVTAAGQNLDSIFAWGRKMFNRFGLDEREIDTELRGIHR